MLTFRVAMETFRKLPSTFHTTRRPSVNFRQYFVWQETLRQLSVWPGDLPSLLSTFYVTVGPSVKLCQLPMQLGVLTSTSINFLFGRENFRKLPSIFHAAERPSINFRQHSVRTADFSLTSVKLACGLETFWQLPSTFRAAG